MPPITYIYMPWDYHKTEYAKQAKADPIWHLERLVKYEPKGEKLDLQLLKKYLAKLKIPEDRRAFLELVLWGKPF